jgi:hypothetical protein
MKIIEMEIKIFEEELESFSSWMFGAAALSTA